MKKFLAMLMIACFAFGMVACGDDDDSACDEYVDMIQGDIDSVCDDYPDCSICEEGDSDGDTGEADEDACQEAIDAYDSAAMIELYEMACEAEEAL